MLAIFSAIFRSLPMSMAFNSDFSMRWLMCWRNRSTFVANIAFASGTFILPTCKAELGRGPIDFSAVAAKPNAFNPDTPDRDVLMDDIGTLGEPAPDSPALVSTGVMPSSVSVDKLILVCGLGLVISACSRPSSSLWNLTSLNTSQISAKVFSHPSATPLISLVSVISRRIKLFARATSIPIWACRNRAIASKMCVVLSLGSPKTLSWPKAISTSSGFSPIFCIN
mmetsp:Transcript_28369/g.94172  ORF Transcript_28369/g.94172 Transcript_28369/m.94172 type:complete len:225 (+) Transcript_28369:138-812(+)